MKKLLKLGILFFLIASTGYAQEECAQHTILRERLKDPVFAAQFAKDQAKLNAAAANYKPGDRRGTVYRVPVVFHVLHNGGAENISNAQVKSALVSLNRDFRRQNPEADQVHPDFIGMPADIEIEFVMATIAPDGKCFNGITRTQSPMAFDGNDGQGQVEAIRNGNDVYRGEWPGDQYLNIFVCGTIIDGAAGYTYYPSWDYSMTNGIWMLHNYVGNIGTAVGSGSRGTLSHEAGHWFNLAHVWGSTNSAGVECGDDYVDDTPETRGATGCNLNENYCGPRANVENYMDYAGCRKMFTPGQAARMRAAIETDIGGRNNLWTVQNLQATGANESPLLCKADFSSTISEVCAGNTIAFSDESYNGVTSWNWTFPGGTPATSTLEKPVVTYATPGTYSVTLAVSNGPQSLNVVKQNYVKVYGGSGILPFIEGFEGAGQLSGLNMWTVKNPDGNKTWEITDKASHGGTNSVWINNYAQDPGNIDELISGPVDLSGITDATKATLSFRVAYRKIDELSDDYLKVFLSNNCGEVWTQRKTLHGSSLSPLTASSSWKPTSNADWVTMHVTNVVSMYWNSGFRCKFRFESDGGNNIYLDNINIYSGAPSETVVVGVKDQDVVQGLNVYPNPAENEVNIAFNSVESQSVTIALLDVSGKEIQQHQIAAVSGNNLVVIDASTLSGGMYFAKITTGAGTQEISFVKR